jgi:hypothetical protein
MSILTRKTKLDIKEGPERTKSPNVVRDEFDQNLLQDYVKKLSSSEKIIKELYDRILGLENENSSLVLKLSKSEENNRGVQSKIRA